MPINSLTKASIRKAEPDVQLAYRDFLQHFVVVYEKQIRTLRRIPKEQRNSMIESQLRYWEHGLSHTRFFISQLEKIEGGIDEQTI